MKKIIITTQKILIKFWPCLTIIVLVFLFFWKFVIKGLVPIPADIIVGMYFPWLDYKWGYAVGVPVKNSLLSDVVSQIYPLRTYAVNLFKSGVFPKWNPLMFGGYPLLANIQLGILNPTNIFYLILPDYLAWGWQILSQPLLAAIFTYLFLRSLKLKKLSSVLGALAYAFAGFNLIWMEWGVHGFATSFLPLMLFATVKYFENNKVFFGPLISLSICLQIFSGYPQIVIYSLIVLTSFVLFNYKFSLKKIIFFVFWIFLGFGLSAVQLFPTIELFINSQRKTEALFVAQSYLPWKYLISFFSPDFFGNQTTGNFWGQGDYTNNVGYSGLIVFILATYSFFIFKKNKTIKFFIFCFFFSLFLALPILVFLFAKFNMFIGQGAMAATRIIFIFNFSLAVLASFSFDFLWKEVKINKKIFRTLYFPFIVLGGVYLGCFLALKKFNFLSPLAIDPFSADTLAMWTKNLKVGLRNLILPSIIFFGIAFLFITLIKIKRVKNICLFVIFIAGILELFRFGWKFTPFSKPDLIFPSTPIIDFLKAQEGIFRVDGGDAVPMNMLTAYNLESFSAYDPMYPLKTAQFLSLVDNGQLENPKSRYGRIDSYSSNLFDLANICYVLAVKRDQSGNTGGDGEVNNKFALKKFEKVFEDRSVAVLKNKSCFPRAWLSRNYEIIGDEKNLAEKLKETTDLNRTIFLENNPQVIFENQEIDQNEKIIWKTRSNNYYELEVELKNSALLFISDSYYPGWKAYVDDKETEIYRADLNFRTVFIPLGKHKVNFVYNPLSVKFGFIVSLIFFLLLIGILLKRFVFKLPLFLKHKL